MLAHQGAIWRQSACVRLGDASTNATTSAPSIKANNLATNRLPQKFQQAVPFGRVFQEF
jgi:hypothetical protein